MGPGVMVSRNLGHPQFMAILWWHMFFLWDNFHPWIWDGLFRGNSHNSPDLLGPIFRQTHHRGWIGPRTDWKNGFASATPAGHGNCWIQNSLHLDRNIRNWTQTELEVPRWSLPNTSSLKIISLGPQLRAIQRVSHVTLSSKNQSFQTRLIVPGKSCWEPARDIERLQKSKVPRKSGRYILDHLGSSWNRIGDPIERCQETNWWFQPTCFQAHGAVSFSRTSLSRCIISCCGHNVSAGTYDVLMMSLCPRFSWCGWANL